MDGGDKEVCEEHAGKAEYNNIFPFVFGKFSSVQHWVTFCGGGGGPCNHILIRTYKKGNFSKVLECGIG
jgi:hypothetical protein